MEFPKLYARENNRYYHVRDCPVLSDGDFERLGYEEISVYDISRRKKLPCSCIIKMGSELVKRIRMCKV